MAITESPTTSPTTDIQPDYVMVPRELTQAMLDATCATADDDKAMRETWADLLSAAPASPIPTSVANEGERIREVTAEMRRFMPNACGDWADKIDAALASREGRKVAFYDESGQDIRPGETLPDRDRRIYQQGWHDALNDEPEAFA